MAVTLDSQLADRSRWSTEECSIAKTLEVLSTKTSVLIVRECFYGTTRFDDFEERVGVSAPAISRALTHLENAGVLSKTPYQDAGRRTRYEYVLTDAGRDLFPVLMSLLHWGDRHRQPDGKPLSFVDRASQREVSVVVAPHETTTLPAEAIEVKPA